MAGGVVGEVAKLPALVLLVCGEIIDEGDDGLEVGRQVQVAQQLLRILIQLCKHHGTARASGYWGKMSDKQQRNGNAKIKGGETH